MDFLSFELLVQAVRTMLKELNWWWEGSVISCKSDTECNLEIKVVCCDHEEFLGNNSSFSLTMWVFSSVFNTADVNVQRADRLNKGDWQVQYQKCKWSCRGTIFFLFLLFSVTSYHKYKILIFFLFFWSQRAYKDASDVFTLILLKPLNIVLTGYSLLYASARQREIISNWKIRCF